MSNRSKGLLRVLAAIVFGAAAMSEASTDTAIFLRQNCEQVIKCRSDTVPCNSPEYLAGQSCLSYIDGYLDGRAVGFVETGAKATQLCVPDGVTNGQVAEIFLKYTSDYPAELRLSARFALYWSLVSAFPCA